jgi:hypothetical protein
MSALISTGITLSVIGAIVYLLSGNWKKVLVVIGSWGLYDSLGFLYDYILWPLAQNAYGDISIVFLTAGAMGINFLVLNWYQRSGNDWLGVNYLEEVKAKGHKWADRVYEHESGLVRVLLYVPAKGFQLVIWLLNKNDILAFIFLSLWKDSFVTTAFLRHGRFGKLERRDYEIFIPSTIISCLAWGIVVKIGLLIAKTIWSATVG